MNNYKNENYLAILLSHIMPLVSLYTPENIE